MKISSTLAEGARLRSSSQKKSGLTVVKSFRHPWSSSPEGILILGLAVSLALISWVESTRTYLLVDPRTSVIMRVPALAVESASSLRRELRVSIKLQEFTLLTTVCSNWHTFITWRFCMTHELFLWLACMPARDKGSGHGIIRHKPLDHLTFAFWTLPIFVCHSHGSDTRC